MVWKLIPSAIFPHYLFGNVLSQWFLFGAKQLCFLPLDLSLKYEAFPQVWATKNRRLRAFPNGLDVRSTECNVRDFQRCRQTRSLPLTFLYFERLVVNAWRLSSSCSIPSNLRSMSRLTTDVHDYRTRSASNQHYYAEYSRTKKWKDHLGELVYLLGRWENLNLIPKSNKLSWRFFRKQMTTGCPKSSFL